MTGMDKRNEFTYNLINRYIAKDMRVLDFGCGNGEIIFYLSEIIEENGRVDGVEINGVS